MNGARREHGCGLSGGLQRRNRATPSDVLGYWTTGGMLTQQEVDEAKPFLELATKEGETGVMILGREWAFHELDSPRGSGNLDGTPRLSVTGSAPPPSAERSRSFDAR